MWTLHPPRVNCCPIVVCQLGQTILKGQHNCNDYCASRAFPPPSSSSFFNEVQRVFLGLNSQRLLVVRARQFHPWPHPPPKVYWYNGHNYKTTRRYFYYSPACKCHWNRVGWCEWVAVESFFSNLIIVKFLYCSFLLEMYVGRDNHYVFTAATLLHIVHAPLHRLGCRYLS